jgi:hypothetical protein
LEGGGRCLVEALSRSFPGRTEESTKKLSKDNPNNCHNENHVNLVTVTLTGLFPNELESITKIERNSQSPHSVLLIIQWKTAHNVRTETFFTTK